MTKIVITGIGLISALGCLEATWQRLLAKESAIKMQQPFPELPPYPLALVDAAPSSSLGLLHQALTHALKDANLQPPLPDCGVVVGSSRSQQHQWETLLRTGTLIDGEVWLSTLPHTPAIATAQHLQTNAAVLAPMAACATGLWAIAQGYELLRQGQHQQVVVGAVETPITPLTLAGFARMGALATTGCYPFDRHRQGLVLGEAAVVFVLEQAATARQRSAPIYGQILGAGLTADGYHVSAPDPNNQAAIAAIHQCLHHSHLSPDDIDFIHAHGTATQLNDRNEARLIQAIFPDGIPVSSTKGATGHTLGASGALGVALCLLALRDQILPPCVGLTTPDVALNVLTTAQPAHVCHLLCLSFGFGGQNAVLALGKT
ncbi:MAG: beta-ketoacyl-ACP synthase [Cyanobacteria bacterium]|nr:beta-ketoacyl-ACP synthase [Cyanobacteriota bacterium]MDW8201522.1 beta-ketoacyl-ACP synthase [Cyanobacteriota bacterium SKYGB_h_bin112]